MSSPRISQRKKKKLDMKPEDCIENEYTKSHSTNLEESTREKQNFMKVCLLLSQEAYQNVGVRFNVLQLLDCKDGKCTHNGTTMPHAVQQSVNIELVNSNSFEALETCIKSIWLGHSLPATVLKNIVEIIMNIQDDNSEFTIDYILRKCYFALSLNFTTHPPCSHEDRDCYRNFLTTPMDAREENLFTNRKQFSSEKGIVAHCFDRLVYEISKESKDGSFIDKQSVVPPISEGVQALFWKKQNLELFEFLDRPERINRLMVVLESIIELLQTDLALWHIRYFKHQMQASMRLKKPLLSYILWPGSCIQLGTVSLLCQQIMKVFAYFIHLQYPKQHIKTMSIWMNIVVQMFYIYGSLLPEDYPSPSVYCVKFADEFCQIISSLPSNSVLQILEHIQPVFMRHLVGECYIKSKFNRNENDIILIINSCIENAVWKNYVEKDRVPVLSEIQNKMKSETKPYQSESRSKKSNGITDNNFEILDAMFAFVQSLDTDMESVDSVEAGKENPYSKLELDLKKDKNLIPKSDFINILFVTLTAYLETYGIKEFHSQLKSLNANTKNDHTDAPLQNFNYNITKNFVKKYIHIIESLKILFNMLKQKDDEFSKKLSQFLTDYLS